MTIPAGKLRERIAIETKNLVDNGKGGRKRPDGEPEWLPFLDGVPAEIIPLRGNEAVANLIQRSVQMYKVTVRAQPGIATTQRVVWDGIAMNIRSAALSTDRRDLVMTCEAGVAA